MLNRPSPLRFFSLLSFRAVFGFRFADLNHLKSTSTGKMDGMEGAPVHAEPESAHVVLPFVKYGDTDLLDGFSATSSHYFLWHFKNVLKNVLNINSSMHMIPGEQFSLCKKTWKRPQKCSPGIICPLILNTILHEIAWTLRNVEKIRRTVDEICKKMPLLMRWVLPKKVQQFRFWREAI